MACSAFFIRAQELHLSAYKIIIVWCFFFGFCIASFASSSSSCPPLSAFLLFTYLLLVVCVFLLSFCFLFANFFPCFVLVLVLIVFFVFASSCRYPSSSLGPLLPPFAIFLLSISRYHHRHHHYSLHHHYDHLYHRDHHHAIPCPLLSLLHPLMFHPLLICCLFCYFIISIIIIIVIIINIVIEFMYYIVYLSYSSCYHSFFFSLHFSYDFPAILSVILTSS